MCEKQSIHQFGERIMENTVVCSQSIVRFHQHFGLMKEKRKVTVKSSEKKTQCNKGVSHYFVSPAHPMSATRTACLLYWFFLCHFRIQPNTSYHNASDSKLIRKLEAEHFYLLSHIHTYTHTHFVLLTP